ncbi:Uncharacterized protein OBRU01_11964 [Operophtera brumata]|uniref:DUF4746 domain-containing protein n=1 Tax=Operophtera brumata TaxID=104452 RepID=A0A0L7LB95_OPEBR|nr:Uncharacterized protein OBRU01_11964 [Operophtera brumata]
MSWSTLQRPQNRNSFWTLRGAGTAKAASTPLRSGTPKPIPIIQTNLQHSLAATASLRRALEEDTETIALIQETWIRKGRICGLNNIGGKLLFDVTVSNPRTCIYTSRHLQTLLITEFCSRDLTAVRLYSVNSQPSRDIVLASVYLPGDEDIPSPELMSLVLGTVRETSNLELETTRTRNLHRHQRAPHPVEQRQVQYPRRGTDEVSRSITDWRVSDEASCSDHRWIRFNLNMTLPIPQPRRVPRLEVYSDFCGFCLATGNAIRKGKLEIGQDRIAMAKKGQLTRAMFGANGIELCRIIEEELGLMQKEIDTGVTRPKQDISQMLPEEEVKLKANLRIEEEYREAAERLRVLTTAERKKRVTLRLSQLVKQLNFILFWPHCHDAHPALYEKWDLIKVLYMSDVDPNEACIHALCNGECLAVLFKMDDNRDFIKLLRYALYEEIPIPKEDVPVEKQVPPIPAYERYASMSKTKREVRRERHERKERLASEQARLAREAEEDRLEKGEAEEDFHSDVSVEGEEYIPPGGLFVPGLYAPPNEMAKANGLAFFYPKVVKEMAKIESEFLPPHVLVMFHIEKRADVRDIVKQYTDEILALGIFVGDEVSSAEHIAFSIKQYEKMERHRRHADLKSLAWSSAHREIMSGCFSKDRLALVVSRKRSLPLLQLAGLNPCYISADLKTHREIMSGCFSKDRLALMVSRKRSLPLLQLAGLNPCYISADLNCGERDCLKLFPVGYGDDFEEEESIVEEEEIIAVEVTQPEQNEDEKENEED